MPVELPSYPVYTCHVELTTSAGTRALGGFWQVNGLPPLPSADSAYLLGDPVNHPRKITGVYKVTDIVLKRGVVDSAGLSSWINGVRNGSMPAAACTVLITLRDPTSRPTQRWKLHSATPKHWAGPALSAKGGGDVAMEELTLAHDGLEIAPLT